MKAQSNKRSRDTTVSVVVRKRVRKTCTHFDEVTGKQCKTPQKFIEGGIRGKCSKHGGFPFCVCKLFTVRKVGGLCCFCDPDSKTTRLQKEMKVRAYLKDFFPDVNFECGRRMYLPTGSTCDMSKQFYIPDMLVETAFGILIVEVDENQHKLYKQDQDNYSCDNRRMVEVFGLLELPVLFIRYNPDAFKVNLKTTRVPTDVRMQTLRQFVGDYINGTSVPDSPLGCVYLYYDCDCSDSSSVTGCAGVHYGMKLTK